MLFVLQEIVPIFKNLYNPKYITSSYGEKEAVYSRY